ncbi:MAG: portal protein [Candidatus Dojkabacteria bacterium]|nr:portal protein [Candidatus Dojkabacteria bacterium]
MSNWKKYFQTITLDKKISALQNQPDSPAYANKFSSYLPEIYSGSSNRLERYQQYDQMDQDSEINASLDTIADFATSVPENSNLIFEIVFLDSSSPTPVETNIIKQALIKWCKINKFSSRLWRIFRSTIKYGDQFFLRDPETFELLWIDHYKVQSVIVNPAKGKKPEYYVINDLDINLQTKVATLPRENAVNMINSLYYVNKPQGEQLQHTLYYNQPNVTSWIGKFRGVSNTPRSEIAVNADHIVHFSLSEGLDALWPFGSSILESVFKVYKQKELLEDALIIYRVQRAPERRVFYIDVGNMPPHKAISYVERIKNEIHQRRIPNKTGGGTSILDASYNPLCLSLDTKIPLLNNTEKTIREIIDHYENKGENLYTYSINENTLEVEVSRIVSAKITGKNKKLMRIHLDNSCYVDCTPDHRFITRDGKEVKAEELTIGTSLMPFYLRKKELSKNCKTTYLQIYNPSTNEWKFVHRLVKDNYPIKDHVYNEKYKNKPKEVIHHLDFNRFNNTPENLVLMNSIDHWLLHSEAAKSKVNREKISLLNKRRWKDDNFRNSVIEKQKIRYSEKMFCILQNVFSQNSQNQEKILSILNKNKEFIEEFKKINNKTKCANKDFSVFTRRNLICLINCFGYDSWKKFRIEQIKAKKIRNSVFYQNCNFDEHTKDFIKNIVSSFDEDFRIRDLLEKINQNKSFLDSWKNSNKKLHKKCLVKKSFDKFNYKHLRTFVISNGYANFDEFKKNVLQDSQLNHKITKIEYLEGVHDVGDIQIDSPSGSHWFAVSAGIFVHNSILEDYFFPITAEGRGSKVETLPAGENLGQIDDLRYFDNKLKRGLRVPSSYLPSGPEDGQTSFNDGKIGNAYIQEYRFSKYVQRLQNLLQPTIDKEFKYFLKVNGINVDTSSFYICFWQPQNFGKYRQLETDAAQIQIFSSLSDVPWLSKRFIAKRYLGLTDDEIIENEKLWLEENSDTQQETKNQDEKTDMFDNGMMNMNTRDEDIINRFGEEDNFDEENEEENIVDNTDKNLEDDEMNVPDTQEKEKPGEDQ